MIRPGICCAPFERDHRRSDAVAEESEPPVVETGERVFDHVAGE
jgi:hypothetical protein